MSRKPSLISDSAASSPTSVRASVVTAIPHDAPVHANAGVNVGVMSAIPSAPAASIRTTNHENGWSRKARSLVKLWMGQTALNRRYHHNDANKLAALSTRLKVAVAILVGLSAFISFINTTLTGITALNITFSVLAGFFAAAGGVVGTINTIMGLDSEAEKHRQTSVEYARMSTKAQAILMEENEKELPKASHFLKEMGEQAYLIQLFGPSLDQENADIADLPSMILMKVASDQSNNAGGAGANVANSSHARMQEFRRKPSVKDSGPVLSREFDNVFDRDSDEKAAAAEEDNNLLSRKKKHAKHIADVLNDEEELRKEMEELHKQQSEIDKLKYKLGAGMYDASNPILGTGPQEPSTLQPTSTHIAPVPVPQNVDPNNDTSTAHAPANTIPRKTGTRASDNQKYMRRHKFGWIRGSGKKNSGAVDIPMSSFNIRKNNQPEPLAFSSGGSSSSIEMIVTSNAPSAPNEGYCNIHYQDRRGERRRLPPRDDVENMDDVEESSEENSRESTPVAASIDDELSKITIADPHESSEVHRGGINSDNIADLQEVVIDGTEDVVRIPIDLSNRPELENIEILKKKLLEELAFREEIISEKLVDVQRKVTACESKKKSLPEIPSAATSVATTVITTTLTVDPAPHQKTPPPTPLSSSSSHSPPIPIVSIIEDSPRVSPRSKFNIRRLFKKSDDHDKPPAHEHSKQEMLSAQQDKYHAIKDVLGSSVVESDESDDAFTALPTK